MKKRHLRLVSLLVLACLLLAASVCARWNVVSICEPDLWFVGSTAHCALDISASDNNADITATIKLQKKGFLGIYSTLETWKDVTGTGDLSFYDTYSPVESGDYRLTADIDVTASSGSDSFAVESTAKK